MNSTPVSLQVQYTFIYQALLEYYLYGDTELDVSSLERHLQTLHSTATHFDKIGLEEEFRVSAFWSLRVRTARQLPGPGAGV